MSKYSYLYPDLFIKDIFSLPIKRLRRRGINTLLIDIDNTLVPRHIPLPTKAVTRHLAGLAAMGFKICVVSNGGSKRVRLFMKTLPYPFIYRAKKPLMPCLNRVLAQLGAKRNETAIIGDQIFTDIFAGKLNKVYTVLVKPISKRDEFFVALKRYPERLIINEYKQFRQKRSRAC